MGVDPELPSEKMKRWIGPLPKSLGNIAALGFATLACGREQISTDVPLAVSDAVSDEMKPHPALYVAPVGAIVVPGLNVGRGVGARRWLFRVFSETSPRQSCTPMCLVGDLRDVRVLVGDLRDVRVLGGDLRDVRVLELVLFLPLETPSPSPNASASVCGVGRSR